MSKAKAPSQRQLRVGELVRHALTEVLTRGEINHPDLQDNLISITEVRMSPDLKIATCFVSPLSQAGGVDNSQLADKVAKALAKHAGLIRSRATPLLKQLKYMPNFRFLADTSFDNFSRIDALLRSDSVQRDIHKDDQG